MQHYTSFCTCMVAMQNDTCIHCRSSSGLSWTHHPKKKNQSQPFIVLLKRYREIEFKTYSLLMNV